MADSGYKLIRVPDEYPFPFKVTPWGHKLAFAHRVVMERRLGRYLTEGEVVHHRDGNPANNAEDNLQLFASQAEHIREAHGRFADVLTLPGLDGEPVVTGQRDYP